MNAQMKKYETFLFSAVGLAALFIVLVAFNYLASGAAVRADLTDGKLYTLSARLSWPVRYLACWPSW